MAEFMEITSNRYINLDNVKEFVVQESQPSGWEIEITFMNDSTNMTVEFDAYNKVQKIAAKMNISMVGNIDWIGRGMLLKKESD
jgi:hypothetical protein